MKNINNKIGLQIVILTLAIAPQMLLITYAALPLGSTNCPPGTPPGTACSAAPAPTPVLTPTPATAPIPTPYLTPTYNDNLQFYTTPKPPTQTTQTGGSRTGLEVTPPSTGNTNRTQTISLPNPLGSIKTIPELIGRIVDWLIFIASIAILPFMIVWGAYQLLTAGGNPDAVTSARHTITWAVAGYALLLISKGIEFIIRDILTRGV